LFFFCGGGGVFFGGGGGGFGGDSFRSALLARWGKGSAFLTPIPKKKKGKRTCPASSACQRGGGKKEGSIRKGHCISQAAPRDPERQGKEKYRDLPGITGGEKKRGPLPDIAGRAAQLAGRAPRRKGGGRGEDRKKRSLTPTSVP